MSSMNKPHYNQDGFVPTGLLRVFAPILLISFAFFVAAFVIMMTRGQVDFSKLQPDGPKIPAKIVAKDLHGFTYVGHTTCQEMTASNKSSYAQIEGGQVTMPKNHKLVLHYYVTAKSRGLPESGDGATIGELDYPYDQGYQFGKDPKANIDLPEIANDIGINKGLESCRIALWSTESN